VIDRCFTGTPARLSGTTFEILALEVCLSVCLSVYLCVCLSVSVCVYLFTVSHGMSQMEVEILWMSELHNP